MCTGVEVTHCVSSLQTKPWPPMAVWVCQWNRDIPVREWLCPHAGAGLCDPSLTLYAHYPPLIFQAMTRFVQSTHRRKKLYSVLLVTRHCMAQAAVQVQPKNKYYKNCTDSKLFCTVWRFLCKYFYLWLFFFFYIFYNIILAEKFRSFVLVTDEQFLIIRQQMFYHCF